MKKISTFFLMSILTFSAFAQQIPNSDFEQWKGSAGRTYQSSNGNEMRKRPGDEPTGWEGSSINQKVKVVFNVTKEETLIYKSTSHNKSSAAKMHLPDKQNPNTE